jgi:hypothetical protein
MIDKYDIEKDNEKVMWYERDYDIDTTKRQKMYREKEAKKCKREKQGKIRERQEMWERKIERCKRDGEMREICKSGNLEVIESDSTRQTRLIHSGSNSIRSDFF